MPAHNILLRGTRVVPNGAASEAVMTELGNGEPVICLVDAVKSSDEIYLQKT
ncbi:MAG: hypothetical protein PXX83_05695 [Candidatus Nitrosotalea sp.]|nr:hypothetical protein [Candidatus Nitrosotalea sp.]